MSLVELFIPVAFFNIFHLFVSSKIMNERTNITSKKKLLIFLFLTFMISISDYTFSGLFRTILNFLTIFTAYYYLYKKNINKTFIIAFIVILFLFIAEIIFTFFLFMMSIFFVISFSSIQTSPVLFSISNVVIGLITIFLFKISTKSILLSKLISNYEKTKFTGTILLILFSFCVLANRNFLLLVNDASYGLSIMIVLLFCSIIYLLLKEVNDNHNLSSKYDQLINYMENYEKELTKKSIIIHEFKNQLIAIKGFSDGKNIDLDQYLEAIIKENRTDESKLLKDMENVPKGGLKGLIYYKLGYLKDEGIHMATDINTNVKNTPFSKMEPNIFKEVMKIVGVLLDNAIESAREAKSKQILLEMYYKKKEFHFILSNTYNGIIDINKISDINYSTKGKNRGYGLALVNKITNENPNIIVDKKVVNDYYISFLTVKLKNTSTKK